MNKHRQRGVTLIELIVVVTIVAILSAIAIPGYRQYVIRANRSTAKVELMKMAQFMERCFTRVNTYAGCGTTPAMPYTSQDGTYTISISGTPNASSFLLQAVPQGGQASDAKCRTFTLNQAGVQALTGSPTQTVAQCWGK